VNNPDRIRWSLVPLAFQRQRVPYSANGFRIYRASSKTGLAIATRGSVPHVVAEMGVLFHENRAQFAASWLCGGGSTDVVGVIDASDYDGICARCEDVVQPGIYRCFNAAGELLYIGCTIRYNARIKSHAATTPWWSEVADVTREVFGNELEARKAERLAIRNEAPKYNRVHRRKEAS
jgi:hypothetical protein